MVTFCFCFSVMGFGFEFGLAFVILNTCWKNFVIVSVSQVDLNFDLGVSFLLYIYFLIN